MLEYKEATREHTTLRFIQAKRPSSFEVLEVIYQKEYNGHYYLIVSRLDGDIVARAWSSIDDQTRDHYVDQVVNICKELAAWKGASICGVDGQHISDEFLGRGVLPHLNPSAVLENCKDLGMDCSAFVFYHCDMGPENVIVNRPNGLLGVIDWEAAGYVPKEWIRTKFRVGNLDLPDYEPKYDWRKRIQLKLGEEGFCDVAGRWISWIRGSDGSE